MIIKKLLLAVTFIFCLPLLSFPVKADDEVRNLQVDLKAKGFSQGQWYNNLDSSNIIFAPNDQFQIQITVSNLGNRNQTQIAVGQILSPSLTVIDGNGASVSGNKLTYTIPQIAPGQNNSKTITVAVKNKSFIKKDLSQSYSSISIRSEIGTLSSDSLYFYTSNGTLKTNVVLAKKTLPATGANPLVTGTIFGASLIGAALVLRRLARGY